MTKTQLHWSVRIRLVAACFKQHLNHPSSVYFLCSLLQRTAHSWKSAKLDTHLSTKFGIHRKKKNTIGQTMLLHKIHLFWIALLLYERRMIGLPWPLNRLKGPNLMFRNKWNVDFSASKVNQCKLVWEYCNVTNDL